MKKSLTPPLKWHGGKSYLAACIVELMPPRCDNPNAPALSDPGWLHYVEPYAGGLAVLLALDPTGISEVVNDLNGKLMNFWGAIANRSTFELFQRWAQATPFAERCWELSGETEYIRDKDQIDPSAAVAFFVRCRQSLAGRMDSFAPLTRNRTRRGMNEQASAWLGAVEGLPAVHKRLQRVVVLNRDALDVIRQQDGPRTLFYLDPPYLHETRATTGEYAHEMTRADHVALLDVLATLKGRFLLSGYRSDLYDVRANREGWRRVDFDLANNAAGGATKRRMTECVWCNFPATPEVARR